MDYIVADAIKFYAKVELLKHLRNAGGSELYHTQLLGKLLQEAGIIPAPPIDPTHVYTPSKVT